MHSRYLLLVLAMLLTPLLLCAQTAPKSAKKAAAQPSRRYINLPKPVQAPFSDAVLVGNTLYIAGRIGVDPKTVKPPERIEEEIRIALDGIKSVLAEAGMTMDDLVFVKSSAPISPSTPSSTTCTKPTSARITPRAPSSVPGRCCAADISRSTPLP